MARTTSYDKNGLKKGVWSREEDDKLKYYIQRYGHWNWNELPRFAGLSRSGKSCRLRWMNYLRPNVRRGNYTQQEDELIIKLQEELGNKWCMIASKLSGRTDNEIKNHWHSILKKRVKRKRKTSEEVKNQSNEIPECEAHRNKEVAAEPKTAFVDDDDDASFKILEERSQVSSMEPSSSEASSSSLSSDDHTFSSGVNLAAVDSVASSDIFSEFSDDGFWTEPFLADMSYQNDFFPSITSAEGGFTFPYNISYSDHVVDLFYQMTKEFPEEYMCNINSCVL